MQVLQLEGGQKFSAGSLTCRHFPSKGWNRLTSAPAEQHSSLPRICVPWEVTPQPSQVPVAATHLLLTPRQRSPSSWARGKTSLEDIIFTALTQPYQVLEWAAVFRCGELKRFKRQQEAS